MEVLSAHYGSPGRLADYRRQFEKTTRSAGEDPSIFAIALETLAVKAFGDMGQTARLRLIRHRFIAGHSTCELRRYLDSVGRGGQGLGHSTFDLLTLLAWMTRMLQVTLLARMGHCPHLTLNLLTLSVRSSSWPCWLRWDAVPVYL